MSKSGKGTAFERGFCRRLSLWWTQDLPEPRDDVFWRTSNSGGRATTRDKQGKTTRNQHGDVGANDPIGQPLIDLICWELKRGYNAHTLQDLLDRPAKGAKPKYLEWIEKAERTRKASGARYWALVVRRDRREPLFVCSYSLFDVFPFVRVDGLVSVEMKLFDHWYFLPLESLFESDPSTVKELCNGNHAHD